MTALAHPVLHRLDLHVVPVRREGAEDAAVPRQVAVEVGRPLPGAHGAQVRRLQRRRLPLVHGVVGDTVEADLAGAPGLLCRPFDAEVEILGLPRRPGVEIPRRPAAAAGIDAHADIPVGHPLFRIDDLPALVLVGRTRRHIRVLRGHDPPLVGVAVREAQPLAVGTVRQDDRIPPLRDRPIDVRAQDEAVIHGDRHIPVDPHPFPDFALQAHISSSTSPTGRYRRSSPGRCFCS